MVSWVSCERKLKLRELPWSPRFLNGDDGSTFIGIDLSVESNSEHKAGKGRARLDSMIKLTNFSCETFERIVILHSARRCRTRISLRRDYGRTYSLVFVDSINPRSVIPRIC